VTLFSRTVFALAALVMAFGAQAATVTLFADDVKFIFDDSTLYGSGTVIGNNIFFQPTNFKAESLDGAGPDTTNVTLHVDVVVTTDGYQLEFFQMAEQGDYKLNGTGASVSENGQFGVTSLTKNCNIFFPCMDNQIFDAGPLTVNGGVLTAWNADASIALADTTGWGTDTEVRLTLENLLTATTLNSGVGETAFIEKKFEGVGNNVNPGPGPGPIPIPGAVWLFGSALGMIGWMSRKAV
jgi:hypothetical protein